MEGGEVKDRRQGKGEIKSRCCGALDANCLGGFCEILEYF